MSSDPQMDELKALFRSAFFDEELNALHKIQTWVEDPVLRPRNVSQVLPEALKHAGDLRGEALSEALRKPVERTLQKSIRSNPQPIIDILTPVIGSTIRQAITEALQTMVRTLNEILERSLSLKGLRWRWEAHRTKRPLAEVVLARTLIYQVESLFLIHRRTGQLLTHVERPLNPFHSPKMATELINSLRELVQSSFKEGETHHLEKIEFGELSIWIEGGQHTILAMAIRGSPPVSLRNLMRQTLEEVELEYHWAIDPKVGKPIANTKMNELLQACLISEFRPSNKKWSWAVAVGLIFIPLLILSVRTWQDARQWNSMIEKLNSTPGLIVLTAKNSMFTQSILGLRDPRSVPPESVMALAEYSNLKLQQRWIPFDSPSKELDRLEETRDDLRTLLRRVSTTLVFFRVNTDVPTSMGESNLSLIADTIAEMSELTKKTAQSIRLEISGYTGADVAIEKQVPLSLARARRIKSAIDRRMGKGLPSQLIGQGYTLTAPQEGAMATVTVILDELGKD